VSQRQSQASLRAKAFLNMTEDDKKIEVYSVELAFALR